MIRPAEDTANSPDNPTVAVRADDAAMAALYAEFATEDRVLAEDGLADYAAGLAREDAPP